MKKLIIHTDFSETVIKLLRQYELVELHKAILVSPGFLVAEYPDDALSQEFAFWLALAEGCGLVMSYRLDS